MKIDINNPNQIKNLDNKLTLISYLISKGITIPHYCYHNDLSIAGNCRVCLVELKNSPKPVVSCALNAKSCLLNNQVYYDSVLVKKARENILEFLLLNHPVDCPICDQGGECDLQEQSLFFGFTKKRFYKFKRVVSDKNLGPIVKTVMTRCIHCTRCVRFATEIAGVEDLGVFGRGVGSEIGTYIDKAFLSELSGNVIDLCPVGKFNRKFGKKNYLVKEGLSEIKPNTTSNLRLRPVGALTLKSFPFILRGWDIKNYDSIDPTDSFGQDTTVYINKNQVIKIEPQFSNNTSYTWLTDKGRQFFDSIFGENYNNVGKTANKSENFSVKTTKQWESLFRTLRKNFYTFDICNLKSADKHFFILTFENLSLETLNLLLLISQTYSFMKIRRAENVKTNCDLESNFQLDSATCAPKLTESSLCLLLATNTRYEGSYLNLKLRQRYFKGNFKLLLIGSLIDLTFPASLLGSNLSTFKTLVEGNQIFCKDIINASNPILVTNTEIFKRKDSSELVGIVKTLKHMNILTKIWNGYNTLNSSLYETGIHSLNSFFFLTFKDLISFSSIYMVNVNLNNVTNLKKITRSRVLTNRSSKKLKTEKLFMNQSYNQSLDNLSNFIKFKKLLYLPNSVLFENQETFVNTEGLIKKTTKLIFRKKTKNDWLLLRRFIKTFQSNITINRLKDKKSISYNSKNIFNFRNFIGFQFYATQTLTNLNFYITDKNEKFTLYKRFNGFKTRCIKLFSTKLKYWLDDFYIGGKDQFCQDSLVLIRCSVNNRQQTTNFF